MSYPTINESGASSVFDLCSIRVAIKDHYLVAAKGSVCPRKNPCYYECLNVAIDDRFEENQP
ncbi:unnamed protein product [Ceratitis capitata]|uniref:(Mediterranean fruit fly) hypothetical protein n=1 Tax=Ceratitis capitata TaxID=7213 RepID=A0A811UI81_CERCA|nr:unnamed protein product [Ceratitis capitata]